MKSLAILAVLLLGAGTCAEAQRLSPHVPPPGTWSLTLSGGMIGMGSDLTQVQSEYRYRPMASLLIMRMLRSSFQVGVALGGGQIAAERDVVSSKVPMGTALAHAEYRVPLLQGQLSPLVFAQAGMIIAVPSVTTNGVRTTHDATLAPAYGGGFGLEFLHRRRYGVRFMVGGLLTGSDNLDGIEQGDRKDGAAWATLGITWFPFSR